MKLLIVRPIISERADYLEEAIFTPFLAADTEIVARRLDFGTASIESEYDVAMNAPDIIRIAKEGEEQGFDGAIVNCFVDPGLDAVKEAVSYPVVGAGSASIQLALSIGKRIGIVTILPNLVALIRKLNAEYVNTGRVVCVRTIDTPVLNLYSDDMIYEKLIEESTKAILEDGADTIVLGCTGLGGMAEKVGERLAANGLEVPVVDPAGASVKMLEALVGNHLSHCKRTWMKPTEKMRRLR